MVFPPVNFLLSINIHFPIRSFCNVLQNYKVLARPWASNDDALCRSQLNPGHHLEHEMGP